MITTLALDGYDLLANGITPLEGSSLTPARIADAGKADQSSGLTASADDYLDAPYALRFKVEAATANAVKAAVTDLMLRFVPGAELTAAEDSSPSLDTYLIEVEVDGEEYHDDFAVVTFTGTRNPFWHGPRKSLTPLSVDCWGTADVVESIDGEVEAEVILRATSPQATEFIGVGVKHAPGASYDPIDDYSGASDALCVGGEKSADLTLTSTLTAIGTAPSVNVADNSGSSLLCARVATSNASTTYAAASSATAAVGSAVTVTEPAVAAPDDALRGVVLGRVRVPASEMPSPGAGSRWVPTTGISQTGGTAKAFPDDTYQTFTLAARRLLTDVRSKFTNADTDPTGAWCRLYSTVAGAPAVMLAESVDYPFVAVGATQVNTYHFGQELQAGTYAIVFANSGDLRQWRNTDGTSYDGGVAGYYNGSTWVAGDGTDTSIDLYFEIDLEEEVAVGAATPVKAAAASGTAALDIAARLPIDDFAILCDRTASADEGFQYEDGNVYVANAAGQIGGSLLGSGAQVYGKRHGLAPSATNRVVAVADTPADAAPSDIAVSGSYRERWVHLARSS